MPAQTAVALAFITAGGSPLPSAIMDNLRRLEVDRSLYLPGMATLEFYDEKLELAGDGDGPLNIGKELEIKIQTPEQTVTSVFKGVILALEPTFEHQSSYCNYVVRAYDKMYWMHRGRSSATYLQVTDGDVVRKIAGANGLSVDVAATAETHQSIFRDNMSDFEMLRYVTQRNGFVAFVEDGKLIAKPPSELGTPIVEVKYGEQCLEFRPTLSLTGQVNSVEVRGWDRKQKQAVVGTSSKATFAPTATGITKRGYESASSNAGGTKAFHVLESFDTVGAAQGAARAIHNRIAAEDFTAEGMIVGDPRLKPGAKIKVGATSARFNGTYFVTRVRHRIEQRAVYETDFWVGGMNTGTFASLVAADNRSPVEPRRAMTGLLVGIVTNNQDPEKLFRVRLKFPSLTEEFESYWVPVMGIGAGALRGLMILPEVGDEVLVGFEHGDIQRPFVLGGLWNGKDEPPTAQDGIQKDGKTDIREWKSRVGHVIRLTDTSGSEKIEVIDKTNKNVILFDSKANTITIKADKDIVFEAKQGTIELKAMNIKMAATQGFEAKGATGKMEATATFQVEAKASLQLKGAQAELSGTAMAKISGPMVMIN